MKRKLIILTCYAFGSFAAAFLLTLMLRRHLGEPFWPTRVEILFVVTAFGTLSAHLFFDRILQKTSASGEGWVIGGLLAGFAASLAAVIPVMVTLFLMAGVDSSKSGPFFIIMFFLTAPYWLACSFIGVLTGMMTAFCLIGPHINAKKD